MDLIDTHHPLQSFRTRQPGKTLWIVVVMIHVIIRMLLLSIYSIPISTRQNPKWMYRHALTIDLLRTCFYHMTLIKYTMPLSLESGAEK